MTQGRELSTGVLTDSPLSTTQSREPALWGNDLPDVETTISV